MIYLGGPTLLPPAPKGGKGVRGSGGPPGKRGRFRGGNLKVKNRKGFVFPFPSSPLFSRFPKSFSPSPFFSPWGFGALLLLFVPKAPRGSVLPLPPPFFKRGFGFPPARSPVEIVPGRPRKPGGLFSPPFEKKGVPRHFFPRSWDLRMAPPPPRVILPFPPRGVFRGVAHLFIGGFPLPRGGKFPNRRWSFGFFFSRGGGVEIFRPFPLRQSGGAGKSGGSTPAGGAPGPGPPAKPRGPGGFGDGYSPVLDPLEPPPQGLPGPWCRPLPRPGFPRFPGLRPN